MSNQSTLRGKIKAQQKYFNDQKMDQLFIAQQQQQQQDKFSFRFAVVNNLPGFSFVICCLR